MYIALNTLYWFFTIYYVLILVRVLLSWFRGQEWSYNIMSFLSPITDPYLDIFRSFIPPLGGLDISAILAIFLLQFLADRAKVLAVSAAISSGFHYGMTGF